MLIVFHELHKFRMTIVWLKVAVLSIALIWDSDYGIELGWEITVMGTIVMYHDQKHALMCQIFASYHSLYLLITLSSISIVLVQRNKVVIYSTQEGWIFSHVLIFATRSIYRGTSGTVLPVMLRFPLLNFFAVNSIHCWTKCSTLKSNYVL